jgi:hypothetical protein
VEIPLIESGFKLKVPKYNLIYKIFGSFSEYLTSLSLEARI